MSEFRFAMLLVLAALFYLLVVSQVRADPLFPPEPEHELISETFHCTVYFTPREDGYTKQNGFRADLVPVPGIGRKLPSDFLRIVRTEGFGKLKQPIGGKRYLTSLGGNRWKLDDRPLGRRMNPLVPLQSCAISMAGSRLKPGDWIVVKSDRLPPELTGRAWRVDDVGAGVGRNQIDLYWGEDISRDPHGSFYEPARMPVERTGKIAVYRLPGPPSQASLFASAENGRPLKQPD